MSTFNLKILAADNHVYEGPCSYVKVPLTDGQYGILPGHSAMLSAIVPGVVVAKIDENSFLDFANKNNVDITSIKNDNDKYSFLVSQGIISVNKNDVVIAVSSATINE